MSGYFKNFFLSSFFCIGGLFFLFSSLEAATFELAFLSIKPDYRIYFGKCRYVYNKLYFLPCGDSVLAISVGETVYLGKEPYLQKKMLQKARIDAQNQIEHFASSTISASQKVKVKDDKTTASTQFAQKFSRNISVWQVIGTGVSADRKYFTCIIGRVFPRKFFPPSMLE